MEHFAITKIGNTFQIEGFPDAVKVLKITGPKSQRLADLALHKDDLGFTLECLEALNHTPAEPYVLREALWQAAIIRYIKCFGKNESRFSLDSKTIYKANTGALEAFKYFDSLRNKHLAHDENSYAQCLPGAVLNKKDINPKVAKIICLSTEGITLGLENYQNLHQLAALARAWVIAQFDELCNILISELEPKAYDELLAMEGITYTPPAADDVHKARPLL